MCPAGSPSQHGETVVDGYACADAASGAASAAASAAGLASAPGEVGSSAGPMLPASLRAPARRQTTAQMHIQLASMEPCRNGVGLCWG
jgi:hypothetical protein